MRRVAAVLNARAGAVTAPRIAAVQAALGPAAWVTHDLDEAAAAYDAIAAGGFDVVCTGGGDGTFVHAVAALRARGVAPIVFGLRLGSGNAIADVCGASSPTAAGLARDLARAASDEPPRPLRLLRVDGALAHSVGFGLDAAYNLDLDAVAKAGRRQRWARPLFAGALGMYVTAAVRTVPRLARGFAPRLRIVATGPAARLDRRGAVAAVLAPGAVLRDEPTTLAATSTVTTYGRGVELFPHSERVPERVHLRCAHVGAAAAVRDLACILAHRDAALVGVTDHLISSIEVTTVDPCPAHRGGEVWWPSAPVAIALDPTPVAILGAAPAPR